MLTPGEITVGMDVTVLKTEPFTVEQYKDGEGNVVGQKMSASFDVFKGIPLKVAAINLPYVIVYAVGRPYVLDTRRTEFMEITPEYVKALTIAQPKDDVCERDAFYDAIEGMLNTGLKNK